MLNARVAWLLATVVCLCACAPSGGGAVDPTPTPRPSPGAAPSASPAPQSSASPSPSVLPEAQAAQDAATRAAAARTGLPSTALQVERVERRDWPDSSLGCPTPGMLYAQVLTYGYVVVVVGGGRRLEYHVASQGQPVLCQEQ